jgi:transcriptional regulator with XRE-family HTH domain
MMLHGLGPSQGRPARATMTGVDDPRGGAVARIVAGPDARQEARPAPGPAPEYAVIGDHLRQVRQARGLSLRALAARVGVSPSLISQVETGRARPSVRTLYALASELRISLDELLFPDAARAAEAAGAAGDLDDAAGGADGAITGAGASGRPADVAAGPLLEIRLPEDPVQRSTDRKVIHLASGVTWERLTTASIANVDFLYVTYDVGGASSPEHESQRHPGQEWGYVVTGTLGVTIGFDDVVLGPGDAIAFDSTTPHRLYNAGVEPVHGIWFVLGRRAGAFAAPGEEATDLPVGAGHRV